MRPFWNPYLNNLEMLRFFHAEKGTGEGECLVAILHPPEGRWGRVIEPRNLAEGELGRERTSRGFGFLPASH